MATMLIVRPIFLLICLLLAIPAWAQDASAPPPTVTDVLYKGLVGKALDAVPMDAEKRIALQRTNAVVSSTLTGRSLSVWAGLTNPVLLIAGVAWGIFSATNIKTDDIQLDLDTMLVEPLDAMEAEQIQVAQLFGPPAEWDAYDATVVATLGQ